MTRLTLPLLLCSFFVASSACENSKLQRDMMGDSTWETSGDEEAPWEPAERGTEVDEEWEKENAPLPGEASDPESSLMAPRRKTGVIRRHQLDQVLDAGLGQYLQNVETEPTFDRGRFAGFRIVKLFPGDLTYASLDLRPGDIVTSINGKPISRPEQASAIWEQLRTASDLVVDYERNGTPHELRFAIVDA